MSWVSLIPLLLCAAPAFARPLATRYAIRLNHEVQVATSEGDRPASFADVKGLSPGYDKAAGLRGLRRLSREELFSNGRILEVSFSWGGARLPRLALALRRVLGRGVRQSTVRKSFWQELGDRLLVHETVRTRTLEWANQVEPPRGTVQPGLPSPAGPVPRFAEVRKGEQHSLAVEAEGGRPPRVLKAALRGLSVGLQGRTPTSGYDYQALEDPTGKRDDHMRFLSGEDRPSSWQRPLGLGTVIDESGTVRSHVTETADGLRVTRGAETSLDRISGGGD